MHNITLLAAALYWAVTQGVVVLLDTLSFHIFKSQE